MSNYSRLGLNEYFLRIAELVSERSTCRRRKVGCILVDSLNHIVSTGYNGAPSGFTHCLDQPCEGANSPPGVDLDKCMAVHAEINALLQLTSVESLTAYITTTPCFACAKILANSNINKIVAREWYVHEGIKDLIDTAGIHVEIHDSR